MATFEELQAQLRRARDRRDAAQVEHTRLRERLLRVETEQADLGRALDPDNLEQVRRRQQLERAKADLERTGRQQAAELARSREVEAGVLGSFAAFTDPRENFGRLDDAFPVLLLPIRLETRFKRVRTENGMRDQLWVRIFPDDCAVDTFEAMLSETELRGARRYWQEMWRAGGIEADERGAWRALVASHGSGRAAWIVEHYRPLNEGERPVKVARTDVVLVVPTDAAPAGAERAAITAYWRAIWLAGDDRDLQETATAALRAALGDARTNAVVAQPPFNLTDQPQPPQTKATVAISIAFVVFPDGAETTQQSWTHAPTVDVLPDRFVLLAYSAYAGPGSVPDLEAVGNPVRSPLVVGPDPAAPAEQQLRPQDGNLVVPEELQWMTDFERAVAWGLGFKLDLTAAQAARGFDRVLVLGVRISANAQDGTALLEGLFSHHRDGRSGLALLPVGTPTNNSEGSGAGFTRSDDADASYDDQFQAEGLFEVTDDPWQKQDGQWLAEWLGIDPAVLSKVRHSGGTDQREARAMHRALWPATLGYMMGTMMSSVFDDDVIERTRWFFTEFVSGRGVVPAVRIGSQPYGILPTTAFSRMRWLESPVTNVVGTHIDPRQRFLGRLYNLLRLIDADWTEMARAVSFVGKGEDPHRTLLDILGLHPASVEFHYRYAESIEHLFNRLNLEGFGDSFLAAILAGGYRSSGMQLLRRLGYTAEDVPDVLDKFFFGSQGRLSGPVIDDRPLSETEPVRAYTSDGRNYLAWLSDAARTSLDAVRLEQGFAEGRPPTALLYLMLRHAVMLGYHDAGYTVRRSAGVLTEELRSTIRREPAFVHVSPRAATSESRWWPLVTTDARITGSQTLTVAEHITQTLGQLADTRRLDEQIRALNPLRDAPTARLERAFAEHIDCCSYRFDAWLLGLVNLQLDAMRYQRQDGTVAVRRGVYLGAYAWLEDLRPEHKVLTPVHLEPELATVFGDQPPLFRDNSNGGYVHAPSLNHAVTAAVLRNGYLSNASRDNPTSLAVNLSSERIRLALSMLEGMRNGQGLGALLGYRLERGLHDRHNLAEVDRFIYALRSRFPLRAGRLSATRAAEVAGEPIDAIEARNVVDGLLLVEHVKRSGSATYPFGLPLPPATAAEVAAINAEVSGLLDIHDAVADLALAEGVHQAVQGNYDRVAATLDTYTRGNYPPDPEVVRTPSQGVTITHRVALHLETGVAAPANATPRARAEPALNAFLMGVLPPLASIACTVEWHDPVANTPVARVVTMADLGFQPIDLLSIIQTDSEQSMTELDDRALRFVAGSANPPRPDVALSISYLPRADGLLSVFEVSPLVRSLRSLLLRARPLRASDIALHNEASRQQEAGVFADLGRIVAVTSAMETLPPNITAYLATLDPLVADLPNRRADILTGIDLFIDGAIDLFAAAARFGVPQSGWGFAYAWKRERFSTLLSVVRDLIARWEERLVQFGARLADYHALPAGTPAEARVALLHEAEILVATALTPPPPDPADLEAAVLAKHAAFVARRNQFVSVTSAGGTSLANLLTMIRALLPVSAFDTQSLDLEETERRILDFAEDLAVAIRGLAAEITKRLTAAQAQLAAHHAAASATARVQALEQAARALLGDDARIVHEFDVSSTQAVEWQNALTAATSGDLLQYLTTNGVDFPVDEWLYGVARVREKMRAWEQVVMLAGAFDQLAAPELTPLQLPFRSGDHWLALQYPDDALPDGDRLLYTAHYAVPFDTTSRQCGLLLDEWTEVLQSAESRGEPPTAPVAAHETGLTFHFDRPNSEPPQSMLLVTPATWDGAWRWADLVDALHETLDLAKKRAVEPVHVDATAYARFLPATMMAVTLHGISIATALAANNRAFARIEEDRNG